MSEDTNRIRDILEKKAPVASAKPSPADGTDEDYTAYAHGRISRQPQMTLVFRQADGSAKAFAYSYLYGADASDPNAGFVLDFSQFKVRLEGRNLEMLFRLICQHRVAEIRQAVRAETFSLPENEPLVEKIEIQQSK